MESYLKKMLHSLIVITRVHINIILISLTITSTTENDTQAHALLIAVFKISIPSTLKLA